LEDVGLFSFAVPYIQFSSGSISVAEGDSGTKYVRFKVSLSEAATNVVSVDVNTSSSGSSGWGTEGQDYAGVHRTLTFQPGEVTKSFVVKVFGDEDYEANEFIQMQLSNPTGADLHPDSNYWYRYLTIQNDDVSSVTVSNFEAPVDFLI
jgi:hypothetical protein